MSKGVGEGFHEYWIGAFYAVAFTPGDLDRRKDYLLHFRLPLRMEPFVVWRILCQMHLLSNVKKQNLDTGVFHEFEVKLVCLM